MAEVSRHLAFIKEDIPTLKIRLRRHKSFNIVIIDSFQYTQMTYRDYIQLKEEFPDKLFVFISHARGKNPKGDAATSVMYDADLKIWVEATSPSVRDVIRGPLVNTQSGRRAPMTIGMWRDRNRKEARHEQDKETAGDLSSRLYV